MEEEEEIEEEEMEEEEEGGSATAIKKGNRRNLRRNRKMKNKEATKRLREITESIDTLGISHKCSFTHLLTNTRTLCHPPFAMNSHGLKVLRWLPLSPVVACLL